MGFGLRLPAQQDEEQSEKTAVPASTPAADKQQPSTKAEEKAKEEKEDDKSPVVTHHEVHVRGKALKYTATTGMMPITDDDGTTEAHIFFIAYTLDNPPGGNARPLSVCFNCGPRSPSA